MASIPRMIFSAWLQGKDQAPALVKLCFARWERLNPGHRMVILDMQAAQTALAGLVLPPLPMQTFADILRIKLLLAHGGIWADAALFPVLPLDKWLGPLTAESGFFAFARPGPDRPISNWFFAATPGHPILARLWQEILRFWAQPRRLVQYGGAVIPHDPVASVAPGAPHDEFPYFWQHYLFQYLIETDFAFATAWAKCRQIPAGPPHSLQGFCAGPGPFTVDNIAAAASRAPVQKLNWRAHYPMELLTRL